MADLLDRDCHGMTLHEEQGGAGAVAQSVKCLLCKYEDLSSDPHNPFKKPSMVQHSWDSSAGEAETGESLELIGQPA